MQNPHDILNTKPPPPPPDDSLTSLLHQAEKAHTHGHWDAARADARTRLRRVMRPIELAEERRAPGRWQLIELRMIVFHQLCSGCLSRFDSPGQLLAIEQKKGTSNKRGVPVPYSMAGVYKEYPRKVEHRKRKVKCCHLCFVPDDSNTSDSNKEE